MQEYYRKSTLVSQSHCDVREHEYDIIESAQSILTHLSADAWRKTEL